MAVKHIAVRLMQLDIILAGTDTLASAYIWHGHATWGCQPKMLVVILASDKRHQQPMM